MGRRWFLKGVATGGCWGWGFKIRWMDGWMGWLGFIILIVYDGASFYADDGRVYVSFFSFLLYFLR